MEKHEEATRLMLELANLGYDPEYIVAQWVASIVVSGSEKSALEIFGDAIHMTGEMMNNGMSIWPGLLPGGPPPRFMEVSRSEVFIGGQKYKLDEYGLISWEVDDTPSEDSFAMIYDHEYKFFRYVNTGSDMVNVLCSKTGVILEINQLEADTLGKAVFERIASA